MFFRVDEVVGGDFKCFLTAVLGFLEPVALVLRSEADVDCFVCPGVYPFFEVKMRLHPMFMGVR